MNCPEQNFTFTAKKKNKNKKQKQGKLLSYLFKCKNLSVISLMVAHMVQQVLLDLNPPHISIEFAAQQLNCH